MSLYFWSPKEHHHHTHTHAHKDTHRLCNPSLHMLQIQMKTMATDQRGFSRWDGKVKTGNECLNISVASWDIKYDLYGGT